MKKILFKIVLLGLSFMVTSLIGEGILTAYRCFKHQTLNRGDLISIRENMLEEVLGPAISHPHRRWENSLVIHPFFGYVYNSKLAGVNNFGFKSKYDVVLTDSGYSLANGRKRNLLVVGIFGGSFAEQAGSHGEYLEKKLKDLFPGRQPIVMNFAVGGHALPQSAFIFFYFKELLDIAVFIDGLNEVWNSVENNKAGYPPEYAKAAHFQYKLSLNELSPERFILTSRIIAMKEHIAWITKISLLPIINQSLLVHYIWWVFSRHLDYQISLKSLEIKRSYEQGSKFFGVDDEFILDHAVKKFKNHHRLIHEISSLENILDIHLIQPNPFVENSKTLTSEEINMISRSYNIRDFVVAGYPKLSAAVQSMEKSGLIAEDLSYLFRDVKESIWVDGAHANKIGYEIVLDKVIELISEQKPLLTRFAK